MTFEDWLRDENPLLTSLVAYARSPMPVDAGERARDMDMAIRSADNAGRLLADAESFLSMHRAQATLGSTEKYGHLNAKSIEAMIKSDIREIQRIVDGLEVTVKTLNNRIYAVLNANRSRL